MVQTQGFSYQQYEALRQGSGRTPPPHETFLKQLTMEQLEGLLDDIGDYHALTPLVKAQMKANAHHHG